MTDHPANLTRQAADAIRAALPAIPVLPDCCHPAEADAATSALAAGGLLLTVTLRSINGNRDGHIATLDIEALERPAVNRLNPGFITANGAALLAALALDGPSWIFNGLTASPGPVDGELSATAAVKCLFKAS